MESRNLEAALLHANTMMNVNRGFVEVREKLDDDIVFLEDEDADEFYQMTTEFDYVYETFRIIERKYEDGKEINMIDVDMMANYIDLMRSYLESISDPF